MRTPNPPLDLHMASYEIPKNSSQSSADIVPLVNQTGEDIAARAGATVNRANYNEMKWFATPHYGLEAISRYIHMLQTAK